MNILVILRGVCLPVDNDDLDSETEHLFEGFAEGVKVFVCDDLIFESLVANEDNVLITDRVKGHP